MYKELRVIQIEEPVIFELLSMCQLVWDKKGDQVKTAAVGIGNDGKIQLILNPEFFYNKGFDERVGILWHEGLHLLLPHIGGGHGYARDIANVVMDVELNQFIPERFRPLGALMPENVPQLRNSPDFDTYQKYYIDYIENDVENKGGKEFKNKRESGEGESGEEGPQVLDNHDFWKQSKKTKQKQQEIIKSALKNALSRTQRNYGSDKIDPRLKSLIEERLKASKTPWHKFLRETIGSQLSINEEASRLRSSRKYGLEAPGRKDAEAPQALIGCDISGSMGNDLYIKSFHEIKGICEQYKDSIPVVFFADGLFDEIMLVDADIKKIPDRPGSGGTSFKELFDKAQKDKVDVLIILTDGDGAMPEKPSTFSVIWVLLDGDRSNINFGTKVIVEKDS